MEQIRNSMVFHGIKSSVSFWLHLPFGGFVLIPACKPEQHYWMWGWENHPSSKGFHESPDNHILSSSALFHQFLAKEIRWVAKNLLVLMASCLQPLSREEELCLNFSLIAHPPTHKLPASSAVVQIHFCPWNISRAVCYEWVTLFYP